VVDEAPGLAEALRLAPAQIPVVATLTYETDVPMLLHLPDVRAALLLKAYAYRGRWSHRDALDIWRLLEAASNAGHRTGDWPTGLGGRDAAQFLHMDLQMPGLHGIEATKQVDRAAPDTAALVLTMFDDDDSVFAALTAGAAGYLLKGSDGADIVAAVRAAAGGGQAVFGPALAKRLQTWFSRQPATPDRPFPELTEREHEIPDAVAAGLTNTQIGQRLYRSPKTVANNVTAILDKLHVGHRAEAIIRACDAGLGRGER